MIDELYWAYRAVTSYKPKIILQSHPRVCFLTEADRQHTHKHIGCSMQQIDTETKREGIMVGQLFGPH